MRRLFIQDSESPRTLGQLVLLIGLSITALVITDYMLGRFLPTLTIERPLILRSENVPGVDTLWQYSAAGVHPIVFTGSSQLYTAISPHLFDERIKTISGEVVQSVNIGISGSLVNIQRDLIRQLILPNHPRIIIYGIEMRAVKAEWLREDYFSLQDFTNKPLGYAVSHAATFERTLLLWLLEHSNWLRYRDNLHDWLTGARAVITHDTTKVDFTDELGFEPLPNTTSLDTTYVQTQFIPFHASDEVRELLDDIRSDCNQNGVHCILLNMPIHEAAYQFITTEEEADYQKLIRETMLPIWDFNSKGCRQVLGDTAFFNLNHLNMQGAEIFSRIVADVYASVFYDLPLTGNAACAVISP